MEEKYLRLWANNSFRREPKPVEGKDLLCHCELIPGISCRVRATQEDMLCDSCRDRRCGTSEGDESFLRRWPDWSTGRGVTCRGVNRAEDT